MPQVKENVENSMKTEKRSALWSKCAAKFGKVAKKLHKNSRLLCNTL